MGTECRNQCSAETREDEVSVHRLRAGHWDRSLSYRHRIGRLQRMATSAAAGRRALATTCARQHTVWCATTTWIRRNTCCWSAFAWPACGSAFSAMSDRLQLWLRGGEPGATLDRGYLGHREPKATVVTHLEELSTGNRTL